MGFLRFLAGSVLDEVPNKCELEALEFDVDPHRRLAGGGDIELDYTIFNVTIMTLALLLLVENSRHYIDHKAEKHKFVKRVLEVLYEELSTLGIVESIIFILVKYNQNERFIAVELAFAEVHFMLFYTTIFNAMMSCLVAYGSKRISKNLWVKSEAMDMDHYVTIRREFNTLDEKINATNADDMAEGFVIFDLETLRNIYRNIIQFLKHPQMSRKRNSMLIVIRFHEIRAHFLKENNLPSQFKVSDYLKKCEREVFKKLVHIPTSLWLILIGILNVIYFSMGLVASAGEKFHQKENNHRIGIVLTWLFVSMCIALAIVSFVMLQRIKWIFSKIIHKDFLNQDQDIVNAQGFGGHATQMDLFYFRNPSLVITLLRYMQFAYALAAGTLLVFWDSAGVSQNHLQSKDHDYIQHSRIQLRWSLFFFLVISFLIFFINAKNIIPRFTLCTNLGQLVNKGQLYETLNLYHLEQESWKRKLKLDLNRYSRGLPGSTRKEKQSDEELKKETKDENKKDEKRLTHLEQISHFVHLPTDSLPAPHILDPEKTQPRRYRRTKRSLSDSAAFFSAFPASTQSFRNKIETSSLKNSTKHKVKQQSKTTEDLPIKNKRKRRVKSASAPLRGGISTLFAIDEQKPNEDDDTKPSTRRNSLKSLKPVLSTLHEEVHLDKKTNEVDNISVTTSISMYEGSDTEDVPEATLTSNPRVQRKTPSMTFNEKIRYLYETSLYNTIDTVVGTFFCLYLVGMRLEILLVDSCKIKESENSIEFSIPTAFWLEFSLLVYFILSSSVFIFIHIPDGVSTRRFEIIIAEFSDIFLCGICLTILLTAEFRRCSFHDHICPRFGSRADVGNIEPFTSLILLRPFRHHFGRLIAKWFGSSQRNILNFHDPDRENKIENRKSWFLTSSKVGNPVFYHANQGGHHNEIESKETLILTWTKAVEKNPKLVQQYGMFSSEILQTMLGLSVAEPDKRNSSAKIHEKSLTKKVSDINLKSKKWSRLSSRAKSVIISGEVGVPTNSTTLTRSSSWISNYDSDEDEQSKLSDLVSFEGDSKNNILTSTEGYDFGLDGGENVMNYELKAPHAVLIRSMRRCERKMLPLFSSWEKVDVVITQHEIVFFAVNEYDYSTGDGNEDIEEKMNAVKEAMRARHGGKGLLLSDVIVGRKIVGHTDISHVTSIKVRQLTETLSNSINQGDENVSSTLNEYWNELEHSLPPAPLQERFTQSHVRHLKIHDGCGQTILLRFFCDLNLVENADVEYRDKRVHKKDLKNTMPLLWCHTLVRLLGPDRLDQKLPNFGCDNDDELNDYIEEHSRETNFSGRMRLLATSIVGKRSLNIEKSSSTEVEPDLL